MKTPIIVCCCVYIFGLAFFLVREYIYNLEKRQVEPINDADLSIPKEEAEEEEEVIILPRNKENTFIKSEKKAATDIKVAKKTPIKRTHKKKPPLSKSIA